MASNAYKKQRFKLDEDGKYAINANGITIRNNSDSGYTSLTGEFVVDHETLSRIIAMFNPDVLVEAENSRYFGSSVLVYNKEGSLKELGMQNESLQEKINFCRDSFIQFNKLPFWKRMFSKIKLPEGL